MIFKKLLFFILLVSCSSHHVAKQVSLQKEFTEFKKVESRDTKCLRKVKALKYLAKLQLKNKSLRWLRIHSYKKLCQIFQPQIASILLNHSERIGVLYEDDNVRNDQNKEILKGILQAGKLNKTAKSYIIKKSKLKKKDLDRNLSQLILQKKVGLIISWGSDSFVKRVKKWQAKLDIPTLFIGGDMIVADNTFKVFPNRLNYSTELIKGMKEKGIKRLAILTPTHYENSTFLKSMKKRFVENGIEIVFDIAYDSNNYDSMNIACRTIFDINKNKRWSEYLYILRKEKRKAKAQGFKLNRKLVFLPARVSYDGIFIPDNFKIVNHFLKLFEYYQMPKLALVGTYEWRSRDLTKAKNKHLSGAMFVDFVGDPKHLPEALKKSKNFSLRMDEGPGIGTDYQIMGYYSSRLAYTAIMASKRKKYLVSKALKKVRIKDKFFKNRQAFIKNEFNWPSFSFVIEQNRIHLSKR